MNLEKNKTMLIGVQLLENASYMNSSFLNSPLLLKLGLKHDMTITY